MLKLPAILLFVGAASMTTSAMADGTIKFRGQILDTTCSVDAGSNNQTVDLGTVGIYDFDNLGAYAGAKPFSINIVGCAKETKLDIKFSGALDESNPNLLRVSSVGESGVAAQGVAIALFKQNEPNRPLELGVGSESEAITIKDSATLNYIARYRATTKPAAISPGLANADVQFTVQYF